MMKPRPGQGIFTGKAGKLFDLLDDRKLGIDDDTEVELHVKAIEGFEGLFPSKVIPGGKEGMLPPPSRDDDDEDTRPLRLDEKDEEAPSWFNRKLKSILKDNAIQRHAGNKRYGDLDMKHLYKATTTGRCFTDKDIISNKQYSVALVIDCSGSMSGNQSVLAAKCGSKFIEQFQKMTALSVVLFNAKTEVVKLPHKILNQKELKMFRDQVYDKSNRQNGTYGNHDAFAIRKATEVLKNGKGKKIVVVMSDAQPACSWDRCRGTDKEHECFNPKHGSQGQQTHDAIRSARMKGYAVLGLGVQTSSVSGYYPESEVINKSVEMYPKLIKLLQRAVKRGGGI